MQAVRPVICVLELNFGPYKIGIMKAWFFMVLLLIVLSCEAGKKKKKKPSSGGSARDRFLRRTAKPPPTPSPTPAQVKVNDLCFE